jgi:hypothetical protein
MAAAPHVIAQAPGAGLDDTTAGRILGDLQASGALASGRVHILSLRAIREALTKRWSERRTLVWEMAEAQIRRRIGPGDLTARLNDDSFLIVTPELDPASAQVLVMRILRDITAHFLGELETSQITIMVAQGYKDEQLDCRPLTPAEIDRALATEKNEVASEKGGGGLLAKAPLAPVADGAGELTTLQGRRLRFSVSVAPTIDLGEFAIAGHRIEPKISFEDSNQVLSPSARRALLPHDIQEVDLAVLRRGLARLSDGHSNCERPSLILSISFLTLSNTRSRTRLLAEAAKARDAMAKAAILEISDFDDGAPLGRLKEAAALIRPFCRAVFARVGTGGGFVGAARGLGFSGLVVESPLARASDEDQSMWLLTMSTALRDFRGATIAANLSTTGLLPMAAAAGFSHATVCA